MTLEEEIQQKEFKDENHKVFVNLIYTFNWVEYKHKLFFKPYGLTMQQYNVLRILRGQYPNPTTINLIKERMLDKMSDASRIVERLRVKNLLNRSTSMGDKRSVDILISEEGLNLLKEIDEPLKDHESKIIKLSLEEGKNLNFLLDKIRG
jgi:DNA-binding MarR family transcriptional regulator